jgi:hypothetical protein
MFSIKVFNGLPGDERTATPLTRKAPGSKKGHFEDLIILTSLIHSPLYGCSQAASTVVLSEFL